MKQRMQWIVIGGLVLCLGFVVFGAWKFLLVPLADAYDAKIAEKTVVEEKLRVTKQRALQFEKFQAEAENVRRALEFYSDRLNPELKYQELLSLVDGLGHSLNLTDWSFERDARGKSKLAGLGSMDEIEVRVKFKADANHLGRFLNACLMAKRLVCPDSISIRKLEDPNGTFAETLDAAVKLKIYCGPATGGK